MGRMGAAMKDTEGRQWQPLSALPAVTKDVDEQFVNTRAHYAHLLQAQDRPYVLDDALVGRVVRVVTEQLEGLAVYREQVTRWYQGAPTAAQFLALEQLTHKLDRWHEVLQSQLALAKEISAGTIDKVLATSDFELGAALLSGQMKFPDEDGTPQALLVAKRVQLATVIDLKMQPLLAERADDMTVLVAMHDLMAGFKHLMDTAEATEMRELQQRFTGLDQFARVLGRVAAGIKSGAIQVPR